ncbi:extracellular solute-binding protein [Paenibacillus albiflavus]|uniref:Extracellular solute-binding protein n=1 Tax=Paenibacillus albiflavus TaxID=2545760 RepID=A0A4R4ED94_9BACL|nr:extracellular solute-binding protein [Paenibacillus albiflavus]TCZ77407.1 extracellular solute-binding protein [Paenibacillus albiflavus]
MKKKKLVTMAVALSSLVLASACSSNPSNVDTQGTPAPAETATGEAVKLVMYSWKAEDKAAYEKIIAEYQKEHSNVTIEFKPYKSTEYNTILKNSLTAGSGIDILQLRPYDGARALADSNLLTPLDDLEGLSNITPEHLAAAKGSDGKVYGVPIMLNNAIIFYNKNLLADNGLEVPQTWDELVKVSEALKAKNITPIAQSGKASYLLSMTHSVIAPSQYGNNAFVNAVLKGDTNFKDAKFIDSIQKFKDLSAFFPKDYIAIEDADAQAMFITQKAAMYINGSHRIETFEKAKLPFELDFIPGLAAQKGEDPSIVSWVDGSYAIAKSSKHQAEAKKFLEFIASPKFGQMYSDELNRVSPIKGVTPNHPLLKRMTELTAKNTTPYFMLTHFGSGNPTTKTTFEDSLQGMLLGKLTPEEVASTTQDSADKWFKPKK